MREVALVGVGCTGFRLIAQDIVYKEIMFEQSRKPVKRLELVQERRRRFIT